MARSQYFEPYLAYTATERVTPGTYLSQHLRGKAKGYQGRYLLALLRALDAEVAAGRVERVPSIRGGLAYVWTVARERD